MTIGSSIDMIVKKLVHYLEAKITKQDSIITIRNLLFVSKAPFWASLSIDGKTDNIV